MREKNEIIQDLLKIIKLIAKVQSTCPVGVY